MSEPFRTNFKHELPSRFDRKRLAKAQAEQHERYCNKQIDQRDRRICRACSWRSDPEAMTLLTRGHRAHIVYESAGGGMEPNNRVTLCPQCHQDEHRDQLRFSRDGGPYKGIDANQGMEFWRKDSVGQWYCSRRELAPHVVEKD